MATAAHAYQTRDAGLQDFNKFREAASKMEAKIHGLCLDCVKKVAGDGHDERETCRIVHV